MGNVSLSKTNRLYWLGRYVERVLDTCEYAQVIYDNMLDEIPMDHADFCVRLEIPNVYSSTEDFFKSYLFDLSNPDSTVCALQYAFGNALVLRETISSEALSYVQMAVNTMERAGVSPAPMLELQLVRDYLLAFKGCVDDYVVEENSRNIIKCGFSVERIDLYLRLDYNLDRLDKEFARLTSRLQKTRMERDGKRLQVLLGLAPAPAPAENKDVLLDCIEYLFRV